MFQRLAWVGCVGPAVLATACASLDALSGAAAAPGDAGDGSGDSAADLDGSGASDATVTDGSEADAPGEAALEAGPVGDADAGGNAIANASFEIGAGTCGPGWGSYGATVWRSSVARTGSFSCGLCPSPAGATSYQVTSIPSIPVDAGTYYAVAWVHAAEGDAAIAPATGVQVYFHETKGDGGMYFQGAMVAAQPSSWIGSDVTAVIDRDGVVDVDVHAYNPNGGCVLVDDVAFYRL